MGQRQGKRSVWLRRALWGLPLILLIFALLAGPQLLMNVRLVREWIFAGPLVGQRLGDDLRLQVAQVTRFNLGGVNAGGIRLEARDATGAWQTVFQVGRLTADWSPLSLARGDLRVRRCEIARLRAYERGWTLLRSARRPVPAQTAGWSLPKLIPNVMIRQFRLAPFELIGAHGARAQGGLLNGEFQLTRDEISFRLREAWIDADSLSLSLLLADGHFLWRNGAVAIQGLALDGPSLCGTLHAAYNPHDPQVDLRADLVCEHIDPGLLMRVLAPQLHPLADDSLSGSLHVERSSMGTALDIVCRGRLRDEPIEEISAVITLDEGDIFIDDLRAETGAGRVRGSGSWQPAARRLGVDLTFEDLNHESGWLPWLHLLPLEERCAGSLRGTLFLPPDGALRGAGRIELLAGRPWGIVAERIFCEADFAQDGSVEITGLVLDVGAGQLTAQGSWPIAAGEIRAAVTLDSIPIPRLPEAWRMGLTAGRLSGDLTVTGDPQNPQLEGSIRASSLERDEWRMDQLMGHSLRLQPRRLLGEGTIECQGVQRAAGARAQWSFAFSRWGDWLTLTSDLRSDDAEMHAQARLHPRGDLELVGATGLLPHVGRWNLAQPCKITWAGGVLAADSLHVRAGSADIGARGHWNRESGAIDVRATIDGVALRRLRSLLGHTGRLEGSCALELGIHGVLPDPWVALNFSGDSLRVGDLQLGKVALRAGWVDSTLMLGPLSLESSQQVVRLPALRVMSGEPLRDVLAARASGLGSIADAPWRGTLAIERMDLAHWAPFLGLPGPNEAGQSRTVEIAREVAGRPVAILVEDYEGGPSTVGAGGLGGSFAGEISIAGTPRDPRLRLSGQVGDLSLARVSLGSLQVALLYRDQKILLEQLELWDGQKQTTAQGNYPFVLRLLPFEAQPLPHPVAITAELSELNLALLSGFTRWVPDASGRLSGTLTIAGLGTLPEMTGDLQLEEGGFRVPGRTETVYDLGANLRLDRDRIELRNGRGRSGPWGTVRAEGWFAGRRFDLHGRADDVRIFEPGSYDMRVTADSVHVFTTETLLADAPIPHLTGKVEVHAGVLTPDFSGQGAGSSAQKTNAWLIDFDLSLPGHVRVQQSNAKVDLGEGNLHVTYRAPFWNASGLLRILGGNYRLFSNNFTVREGTVDFRDTGTGPDVTVDIVGVTYAMPDTTGTGSEGIPETVTIEVRVQGAPEELQITLSSDPPYSPEDIAELLSYGRLAGAGNLTAQTQSVLFNEILGRAEGALLEQFPLSTTVALETGATGEVWPPQRVSLQQVITSEITGEYSRQLAEEADWELFLQYRLSRLLYLRAGMTRDPDNDAGETDEYHLDLKCWFEYE